MSILAKRLFIGRTPDGNRVYVDVQVERQTNERQTTDHQPINDYDRLSIQGEVYSGRSGFSDRQMVSAGQCLYDAESVLDPGGITPGTDDVALVLQAWRDWHLNDLQAACAHMTRVGDLPDEWLAQTPPCPHTGYRYGRSWLVAPLPDGLVDRLTEACTRLGAATNNPHTRP